MTKIIIVLKCIITTNWN